MSIEMVADQTQENWSANTDGTKFWLKKEKSLINKIMEHIKKGKKVGNVRKNEPGTTVFIEEVNLASLEKVPPLGSSSTKEELITAPVSAESRIFKHK